MAVGTPFYHQVPPSNGSHRALMVSQTNNYLPQRAGCHHPQKRIGATEEENFFNLNSFLLGWLLELRDIFSSGARHVNVLEATRSINMQSNQRQRESKGCRNLAAVKLGSHHS